MVSFTEAMKFAYDNGVGDGIRKGPAKTVSRPAQEGKEQVHVYHDHSMFLGIVQFGFRAVLCRINEPSSYSPSMDDICATDWELDTL